MNFLHNLSTQTASVRMNMKFYRLPIRQFRSRRGLFATVVMTTTLLLMTSLELRRNTNSRRIHDKWRARCRYHWPQMYCHTLPPAPNSTRQMTKDLFSFLSPSTRRDRACSRMIRLGGQTEKKGVETPVVIGEHVACVDAEFQLSERQCLVASQLPCEDRPFAAAVARLACHHWTGGKCPQPPPAHSTPPTAVAGAQFWRKLSQTSEPISLLALRPGAEQLAEQLQLLQHNRQLLDNVQQIAITLNMNAAVVYNNVTGGDGSDSAVSSGQSLHLQPITATLTSSLASDLYRTIVSLQSAGFVLFDVEAVESADSVPIISDHGAQLASVLRTSWLKSVCS